MPSVDLSGGKSMNISLPVKVLHETEFFLKLLFDPSPTFAAQNCALLSTVRTRGEVQTRASISGWTV